MDAYINHTGSGYWFMLLVAKINCQRPNLTIESCVDPKTMPEYVLRSCYDEAMASYNLQHLILSFMIIKQN